MPIQNYQRLYSYIHDYQNLLYDYYSKHAIAYLVTYWNINPTTTVWDNKNLMGGSYEWMGQLSGVKWNKYLLLPIYFPEEISTSFDGQEIGQVKEQESSITIPSSYGITPYAGDIVKLEQQYLSSDNNTFPIFMVTGIEVHPNTEKRYWKLKIKVFQSRTVSDIENQTDEVFVFFDYDKKIHTLAESITLAKLLNKDENLKHRLDGLYDENSGFFNT